MAFWKTLAATLTRLFHPRPVESTGLRLAVPGVPALLLPVSAGTAGVLQDSDPLRRCRLAIQSALASKGRAVLVLFPAEQARFDQLWPHDPLLQERVRRGSLRLLAAVPDLAHGAPHVPHAGAAFSMAKLLRELPWHDAGRAARVILLGAEALFSWEDPVKLREQEDALRRWLTHQGAHALFFLGSGSAEQASRQLSALRDMALTFPGLATVNEEPGSCNLDLYRWMGAAAGRRYGLRCDPEQGWQGNGSLIDLDRQLLLDATDQHRVLVEAAAFSESRGVPPEWEVFADAAALAQAAENLVAATLVFASGQREQFLPLAEHIYTLRSTRPRSLKIFVRESGGKLRYGAEAMLLQLGANAILYRELGLSRVIQHLNSAREQLYAGKVPGSLDALFAAAEPDPLSGYLAPEHFCRSVHGMVTRSMVLGIEHCLLRFTFLPRVTHLDALNACRIVRHGDVVTADREHLYLFLFACREPDIEATLAHLFSIPVEALFSGTTLDPGADLILTAIDFFKRRAEAESLPDFSGLLADVGSRPRAAEAAQAGKISALPRSMRSTWPEPSPEMRRQVVPRALPTRRPAVH